MGPRTDPSKEKPFAKTSLIHTQSLVALREVEVLLESLDKNGTFVGQMWTPEGNFGISLLKEGLALTTPLAKKLKNFAELHNAEDVASKAKKNIWSLEDVNVVRRDPRRPEADDEAEADEDETTTMGASAAEPASFTLRLTEIIDGTHFYYQTPESADNIARLDALMAGLSLDAGSSYAPKEAGELVFARFSEDNAWYRARVLSVEHKAKTATVLYVDFGSTVRDQPFSSLRAITSSEIKNIPF
jgi:staphylococcal nuclease domain-containing protein 1